MVKETLIAIAVFANTGLSSLGLATQSANIAKEQIIARQELDLTNRISNYPYGNQIFVDNILLSLHYLKGDVEDFKVAGDSFRQAQKISGPSDLNWEKIREPFEVSFILKKGESFAFHNNLLPEFKESTAISTNSRFFVEEGYKSLNGLGGNGVCHLATLINWVSQGAGLHTVSKVNHDFSPVPEIPREYGSSIFYTQGGGINSQRQNLYVRNNFETPVKFKFKADNTKLMLSILK